MNKLLFFIILFLPLAYAAPPTEPSNPVPADGAIVYKNYITLFWTSGVDQEGNATCDKYKFGNEPAQENVRSGITETNLELGQTYVWKVKTCEYAGGVCTAACSPEKQWSFSVEAPDAPVLTFLSPANKVMNLGDIETIVLTIRNPNPGAIDANLTLAGGALINNWVWFHGHQYDESRQILQLNLMSGEVRRIVIDVLAGGVGSYVGVDAVRVTAYVLGGNEASQTLNIRVLPREGGLFTEAPDLSSISLIIIAIAAALLISKINMKTEK